MLCDQALNPPFLSSKIIELLKFCFMKFLKWIFSASIYIEQFQNLIQIFNKYGRTKSQTIVYQQNISSLSCIFFYLFHFIDKK